MRFLRAIAASVLVAGISIAHAAPTCTVVNVGAATRGTGTLSPTISTHATGDLLLFISSARTSTETSDVDPSGYTLIADYTSNAVEVWAKIAASGSETGQSISWNGSSAGEAYYVTLRSSTGWPSLGSIRVDLSTGTSSVTGTRYRSLTVSQNNTCAIQVAAKNLTTASTNVASSVSVTSGYTAAGFGASSSTASELALSSQMQSQTTATNLAQNDETITSNTDSANARGLSFTLAMNPDAPTYSAGPAASATTSTTITDSLTPSASATAYMVAYRDTLSAPSCTQIKAGQDQTGSAAAGANSKAVTGADTVAVTIPGTPLYRYNTAHCLNNAGGDSSVSVVTNRVMAAPAGYQWIVLASVGTGSPCSSFNTATNPDLTSGDVLRAPTTTSPGGFTLTVATDCQFSYSGDGSRQSALNILAYDASAGGYHTDDLDVWANNQLPVPPDPDTVVFNWNQGVSITPVDLTALCPDPDGDAVTVTEVSGLAGGISIVSSVAQGTPTTPGISTLVLRCTDITGASVDWQ